MMVAMMLALCMLAACGVLGLALLRTVHQHLINQVVELSEQALYESGRSAQRKREQVAMVSGFGLGRLQRAGLMVSPRKWIALEVTAAIIAGAFACALLSLAAGALAAGAVVAGFEGWLRWRQGKRMRQFDVQFARVLPQLAASVRGSLTFGRALRVAAAHLDEPLKGEFMRVLADAAYGMPLERALAEMAQRTGHPDVRTLAAAARIRSKRGGNMAATLDMLARHVNARLRARRELQTEIASTKLAKWVVACAMPALFAIMYASNADFGRFYREEPLGWVLLGVAIASELVGLAASQRVTSLERGLA